MATILKLDRARPADPRRWAIGLEVSSDCTRITAALVAARGHGLEIEADTVATMTAQVPEETASRFSPWSDPSRAPGGADVPDAIGGLRAGLAEVQASLVSGLLAQAGLAPGRVLAVGVHDPGLWSPAKGAQVAYLGLCDAARLAELSGLNVIDAFPARDVASNGRGGPIAPLAEWVLLRHPKLNRLLLDLGRTTRMSYLPRKRRGPPGPRIFACEVGPGMGLVDLIAQRFSGGECRFDPGGRFAVQGRLLEELLGHWLNEPYFRTPPPRWHPHGIRPERFVIDAMNLATQRGWSIRDVLCTATHFVAETIALAARRHLPQHAEIDEVLITGGGQHNGMLLREIAMRFPRIPLVRVGELGVPSEAVGPASVAILALLHVDQVPANHPEITGAETTRVLGQLTPGSPQNWQRLLAEMATCQPAARCLRSAL